jgi:hypothetical protein
MNRATGAFLVALLLACGTAQAAGDVLLRAVTFALTGSDNESVSVLDRVHCIFRMEEINFIEIYYLNNVDPARLDIHQVQLKMPNGNIATWVEVSLFGDRTVYESRPYPGKECLMGCGGDKEANHRLKLTTREDERVVRAWKYIYSHGCTGSKSSF